MHLRSICLLFFHFIYFFNLCVRYPSYDLAHSRLLPMVAGRKLPSHQACVRVYLFFCIQYTPPPFTLLLLPLHWCSVSGQLEQLHSTEFASVRFLTQSLRNPMLLYWPNLAPPRNSLCSYYIFVYILTVGWCSTSAAKLLQSNTS